MFKFNKLFYTIERLYLESEDAHLGGDRKTVIINNFRELGFLNKILIYKKACVKEVREGMTPILGWKVYTTVVDPKNKIDGFVICIPC